MSSPDFRAASTVKQAQSLHLAGEPARAAAMCEQVLRKSPRDVQALYILAAARMDLGLLDDSIKAYRKALEIAPRHPALHLELGQAYARAGRFTDAQRSFDRALQIKPGDAQIVASKAETLCQTAQFAEAFAALQPLLADEPTHPHPPMVFARMCVQLGKREEGIDRLEKALATIEFPPATRAEAWYRLGELLDGAKEYDRAFAAYAEANRLKLAGYDPDLLTRDADALIANWTRAAIARVPAGPLKSEKPVFIVGVWRSGTTLVEQTLASHPAIAGGGELAFIPRMVSALQNPPARTGVPMLLDPTAATKALVDRACAEYLEVLRKVDPRAARVTDKMPPNFLHLGLISRLFPDCRVIHCIRDPMDTCLSAFFNLAGRLSYSHDLTHLGRFYKDYERIMAHWKSVLDLPILDVVYEEFTADQEGTARRLVDFVGLPWDDRCLKFHENARVAMTKSIDQVRKPMYRTSVARWKHYEKHLGPLKKALGVE